MTCQPPFPEFENDQGVVQKIGEVLIEEEISDPGSKDSAYQDIESDALGSLFSAHFQPFSALQ